MAPSIDLKELQELIQQRILQGRILVAFAGPPGSGKSTLAGELETELNREQPEQAMILPMDGFHYDDLMAEITLSTKLDAAREGILSQKG